MRTLSFRQEPKKNLELDRGANIALCPEAEQESVYFVPAASLLAMRKSSELSRKILFVAIARTFGIPARLNPMDGAMEYLMPDPAKQGADAYADSHFQAVIEGKAKESRLVFTDAGMAWTYSDRTGL